MGNVSNLSLRDNLILRGLNSPERSQIVYATDYGYNKIQQLMDKTSRAAGGSKRIYDQKFWLHKLSSLEVVQQLSAAATTAGVVTSGNVIITFAQANNNFRLTDIIADSRMKQGQVDRIVSSTQVEISPVTGTFSTTTDFISGSYAKVLFDASPNRGSHGKTSLTVTPTDDYNYTGVSRESNHMYISDGIKSYPMYKGKYWYTSHQDMTLLRLGKSHEKKIYLSERAILHQGAPNETYTTGGIRWNIINNGGTYLPLTGTITVDEFHDFINSMMRKTTSGGRNIVALMGQQFLADLQTLNMNAITYGGQANTFGGVAVKGFNSMMYGFGGMNVPFERYPLFDDPELFPEISALTGKPKWSTSCLLLDLTPTPTADGDLIQAIQKRYFGNSEYRMKYLPGMMGLDEMNDNDAMEIAKIGDMSLAVSDLDACQLEFYENSGCYIIPERMGLIELIG